MKISCGKIFSLDDRHTTTHVLERHVFHNAGKFYKAEE
jgi:hypothetical protein